MRKRSSAGSAIGRDSFAGAVMTESLLVIGSLAFDDLEMPSGSYRDVLGGAATYSSMAASLLTRGVRLVGVVGEDFAEQHIVALRDRCVDTAGVERAKGK